MFIAWSKKFHMHIDTSNIVVRAILPQSRVETIDHPNVYVIHKINSYCTDIFPTKILALRIGESIHVI